MLELQLISALDKVFTTGESRITPYRSGVMLTNEQFSFQAVFRLSGGDPFPTEARVRVAAPMEIQVFQVKSVPCE